MNRIQGGFFTIEVLIAAALSSVILMGIFCSYLLMKDQYLKQSAIAEIQENIRTTYDILKKLIDQSTEIKVYANEETPSNLHILSDILEIKSQHHVYKFYIRETLRNKITSLYLKKDDLYAQELIPNVSDLTSKINDTPKISLYVKIKFNNLEIPMIFECEEK